MDIFLELQEKRANNINLVTPGHFVPQIVKALDQARKRENEALRVIFEQAIQDGALKEIRFETYLFTLLAVSYFYYSNRLTLAHTLDVRLTSKEWGRRLCGDLNRIFSS